MLGLMIYNASMTYSKDRSIGKKDRLKIIQYGLNSYIKLITLRIEQVITMKCYLAIKADVIWRSKLMLFGDQSWGYYA